MTSSTPGTWGATSRTVDLGGPVHYADFGGPQDGPRIVLVHGLGGSHLDWCLIGSHLAEQARVVAIDLVAFGLTPVAGRRSSVHANAALLDRFIHEVVGGPALLVGNSMGGMISLLEAAARPGSVAGVVCIAASVPIVRRARVEPIIATAFAAIAVPGVGEKLMTHRQARMTSRALVRDMLRLCCVDPSRVPSELVEAFVTLRDRRLGFDGLERSYLGAARSLLAVLARPWWYHRRMHEIQVPVLLLSGERDRLVPVGAAERLAAQHPDWRLVTFPDVGHVPQLEVPHEVVAVIRDWLERDGAPALKAASG